nr:ATP-dependent dethiobiotin synthetase BioD [Aristophania vespae]
MAAQKENVTINIKQFTLPDVKSPLIIEGAGGLMVPITPDFLMIDLIAQLKLPVVLVARPHLGTLNHTLLSIDALSRRNIAVLGFVFNEGDNPENRHVIEHIGKTSCLFHLPSYNTLEPALISELAHLVPPLDRLSYGRSAEFSLQSF